MEEAEEARAAAEKMSDSKSAFLANMSHELRTPLNGILGYTQILNREPTLTISQQRGLDVIERSGNHLLTLINDILDLSKIEAGKMEIHATDFHLPTLLNSVNDIIQIRAEEKGLNYKYNFQDNLPTWICADRTRLYQVLLNLLNNAVKFTKTGRVTFQVSQLPLVETSNSPEQNLSASQTRFLVKDTGIGLTAAQQAVIFDPFEQTGSHNQRLEGTGLGLTISRTFIELMDGVLNIESTYGQGSTFWFDIALPAGHQQTTTTEVQRQIIGYEGQRQTILVVDDVTENRGVLVHILEAVGFEIMEASDGFEALAKAEEFQIDAVITDLLMPGMNGFELAQRLRQTDSQQDLVIFATSASVFLDNKEESLTSGCDAFIEKPIQATILFNLLQRHLNLTWRYAEEDDQSTSEPTEEAISITPPPEEILKHLYRLALRGDVEILQREVTKLATEAPQFEPFATAIQALIEKLAVGHIRRFIKQHLDKETAS
ncbi:MAG: ATP-binding protein [Chloroflexota bacterium]